MLQVTLPTEIEARLMSIAEHDGVSVSQAALAALEEFIEDREDSMEADEIMAKGEVLVPYAEVKRSLDLDR